MTVFTTLAAPAEAGSWQRVYDRLNADNSSTAQKLATWLKVTEDNTTVSIRQLLAFPLENPGWPRLYVFRDAIEDHASTAGLPPAEIASYFDATPPKSAKGFKIYMNALLKLGAGDKARTALKKFWLDADLDKRETENLAATYSKYFSPTDHIDRLNNLLWDERFTDAGYMMPLVDDGYRKLADARIALGRFASNAPKLVQAVPASLQDDAGLLYSRLKWRRVKNKDDDAFDIIRQQPENLVMPELWWKERNILARRAIEDGEYNRAYKIANHHQLQPGADYAQAEWLLGWLSLERLNQPQKAYQHFDRFYQSVNSAVSRSRAGYWLARAAEKLNQPADAKNWDTLAAQFPSTFYGQLSYEKIYGPVNSAQFLDDHVPQETTAQFDAKELVQAIRQLADLDLVRYTNPFFVKLLDEAKSRSDFILIAKLAKETGHPYFTVESNKQMQQKIGEFMFTVGYPLLPGRVPSQPEKALIHAIVHRESMFDTTAVSSAGARGMMQLMPRTAKQVSKSLGKKFTVDKLTESPQYNIDLGAAYLQSLINQYDGCYPLAIAAYNAGPGNVGKWVREFGNPCSRKTNLINWIEEIPIYETRNYVQRVMESYYIYKLRLSEQPRTVLAFGE